MRRLLAMKASGVLGATLVTIVLAAPSCGADTSTWTCDEAAANGHPCDPAAGGAGAAGVGGAGGSPASGAGGSAGAGGAGAGGDAGSGGSGGLACAAPAIDCGGTCVDPNNDATHCGACGRSCLAAATCSAGVCGPEVMASNEVAPYALADDGANLYWVSPAIKGSVNDAAIRRLSKAAPGGAKANVFSAGAAFRSHSLALSTDGRFLFWGSLNDNALYRGDLQATPLPIAAAIEGGEGNVQHVVFAAAKVYWTSGTSGAVRGKNPADPDGTVGPELFGQDEPGWLAVDAADAARLYWIAGLGTRSLRRQNPAGSNTAAAFASGAPLSVEVAGGVVYWAERGTQALRSAPTSSATLPTTGRPLVAQAGAVEGFAIDAAATPARVYWVSFNAAATPKVLEVWRANLADGGDKLLLGRVAVKDQAGYVGNPFGAAHVRVDAQYVYFADPGTVDTSPDVDTTEGDGVVYRVAK